VVPTWVNQDGEEETRKAEEKEQAEKEVELDFFERVRPRIVS
jgi:hypothetical protein